MLNRASVLWPVIGAVLLIPVADPGSRRANAGSGPADTKTFSDVSREVWNRVREISSKENGTKYEPARKDHGLATTDIILGRVVLDFDYDEGQRTIKYTVKTKPALVTPTLIWNGIQKTIDRARKR